MNLRRRSLSFPTSTAWNPRRSIPVRRSLPDLLSKMVMGTNFLRRSLHSRRPPLSIMAIKDNSFMIRSGSSIHFILIRCRSGNSHPPPKGSHMDSADCNRSEQLRHQIRLTGTPVHLVGEFPSLVNLSFGARYVALDQRFLFKVCGRYFCRSDPGGGKKKT